MPTKASGNTNATSLPSAASSTPVKSNTDNDGDEDGGEDDIRWGSPANATDTRAIEAVLKAYYQAAAEENGSKGCRLIYSIYAEEIPEQYGEGTGPPGLRGSTCAIVMGKLYKQEHRQLIAKNASLRVEAVRVKRLQGRAILHFASRPERIIRVHRERRAWRVDNLLDGPLD